MKRLALVGGLIFLVMVALFLASSLLFRAPASNAQDEIFTIAPGTEEQTPERLAESGFINNTWAFLSGNEH